MSFTVIGWQSYAFTSWNWSYRESEEVSSLLASMLWVLYVTGGNRSETGPNCGTFTRQSAQIFIGAGKSKTWLYRVSWGNRETLADLDQASPCHSWAVNHFTVALAARFDLKERPETCYKTPEEAPQRSWWCESVQTQEGLCQSSIIS